MPINNSYYPHGQASLKMLVLISAFLLALPQAQSQEWSLEPRCGKHRGRPCQQGAFELTLGPAFIHLADEPSNARPQASIACFSRQRGPFKRGVKLGLVGLGSERSEAEALEGHVIRQRQMLPEFSGIIRFEPFRGGLRPFVEGEAGVSASVLDESTFNAEGERQNHSVTGFDPGLHVGWGAGARLKMGKSSLLIFRYGTRIGSPLDIIDEGIQDATTDIQREEVSLGLSLAF